MCSPRFPRYGSYDWQDIFGHSKRFSWKNPAREVCKIFHATYIGKRTARWYTKTSAVSWSLQNTHLTLFFQLPIWTPWFFVAKLHLQFSGALDVFRNIRTLSLNKKNLLKNTPASNANPGFLRGSKVSFAGEKKTGRDTPPEKKNVQAYGIPEPAGYDIRNRQQFATG